MGVDFARECEVRVSDLGDELEGCMPHVNSRMMPGARLFQNGLDRLPGSRRFKQRSTVKTTEGNEVQRLRFLKPLQAARHGSSLVRPRSYCNARSSQRTR